METINTTEGKKTVAEIPVDQLCAGDRIYTSIFSVNEGEPCTLRIAETRPEPAGEPNSIMLVLETVETGETTSIAPRKMSKMRKIAPGS